MVDEIKTQTRSEVIEKTIGTQVYGLRVVDGQPEDQYLVNWYNTSDGSSGAEYEWMPLDMFRPRGRELKLVSK